MVSKTTIGLLGVFLHVLLLFANKTFADDTNESPEQFVNEINELRRQYANKYGVPNMHKIYWSEDLVKMIEKSWEYISDKELAINDIYTYVGVTKEIKSKLEEYLAKSERERFRGVLGVLKLIVPIQKYIGCEIGTKNACYLGREYPQLWDFDAENRKEPGSECTKDYENKDGLCELIDETKASFFGSVEELLDEINSLRHHFANEYHVPDMHKLTWNDDLVKTAESLTENHPLPQAYVTWRYDMEWDCRKLTGNIEFHANQFLKKDQVQRQLDEFKDGWAFNLEYINPQQTEIGCALKFYPDDAHILCLLGPTGSLSILDFDKNSTVASGSKCFQGFENVDGLCTYVPTTEMPTTLPATESETTTEAPTTEAPTTEEPTTEDPTTEGPTTVTLTTEAPTTKAPPTQAPPTQRSISQNKQKPQKQESSAENPEKPEENGQEGDAASETSTSFMINYFLPFSIFMSSMFIVV